MITHNQGDRLKKAGWKGTIISINQSAKDNGFTCSPDEKEMMEWLSKKSGVRITIYGSGVCWYVDVGYENGSHSSSDLTEALIQAVEAVLTSEGDI